MIVASDVHMSMVDDEQGEGRRIIKAVVCANLITSATCSRFSICALETACWWLQTEGLEQQQVENLGPATAGKVGDGERDRQTDAIIKREAQRERERSERQVVDLDKYFATSSSFSLTDSPSLSFSYLFLLETLHSTFRRATGLLCLWRCRARFFSQFLPLCLMCQKLFLFWL